MSDSEAANVPGTDEASTFQLDLYRYWHAAHELVALRLGAHRYLTRSALRQLRARLDTPPPTAGDLAAATEVADLRLFFIRRTLERLSLLRRDSALGLVAGPRSEVERFFALPFDERLRLLVKLWVAGGWWVERPSERQEPPGLRAPAQPSVALARRQALQALLETPPGDLLSLTATMSAHERVSDALAEPARPHARARRQQAALVQLEPVASAILGPLTWIGFAVPVESGPHANAVPSLRATRAVDALRPPAPGEPERRLDEVTGPVVVGADFDVLAYPPHTARTLLTLDTCCEANGTGIIARYRLARDGVRSARRGGWDAGEVARRLTALAGALPQNVAVSLQDWERQADRLRVRTDVAVLRVRTPGLLAALMAEAVLSRAIVRQVSPTCALILDDHADAARQWLLKRGEFPAVIEPDES